VIPLLVICISGSILVFKHELDSLLIGDQVRVNTSEQTSIERLPLDQLRDTVNLAYPDYETVGWVIYLDPDRADQMYLIERGTDEWSYLLLNQYTGEILSQPRLHDHWFTDWLLELHYTLLLGDFGLLSSAIVGVALFVLGLTGIFMYRKFWKTLFLLRWDARLILYFSDLHKTVGIISAPILLILAFTGTWWNITSYLYELEEHTDGHEHPVMQDRLYNDTLSIDGLVSEAQNQIVGFQATYLSFPYEAGLPFTFWGDVPTGNILTSEYSSTVSFDSQTGEHLDNFDIREAGIGSKIIDSYRRLHFGDFAGLTSRILWALLGMSPLILGITGITIWWQRKLKRMRSSTIKLKPIGVRI
jgi:uncharacterized iron-regulated membrane protein